MTNYSEINPAKNKKYNGYLAFLPPPAMDSPEGSPFAISVDPGADNQYRHFHNQDFCWFECKHAPMDQPYRFNIETTSNYLWILIQFLGSGKVEITPALFVQDGMVYCYLSADRRKSISLDSGKNWLFLLGIAENHWSDIAVEYPLLQDIGRPQTAGSAENKSLLGQMTVHAKLLSALDTLSRFEYRPFSLSFRLAAWNLRLLNLVFQELKVPDTSREDTLITLYHKATRYIQDNFREESISTATIADAMHVSVRKLTRCFENRPYTVAGYIQELRLVLARDILRNSQETIASIAFSCHFSSDKHFSRLFKKRFGKGPNAYRIAIQGNVSFKYKR